MQGWGWKNHVQPAPQCDPILTRANRTDHAAAQNMSHDRLTSDAQAQRGSAPRPPLRLLCATTSSLRGCILSASSAPAPNSSSSVSYGTCYSSQRSSVVCHRRLLTSSQDFSPPPPARVDPTTAPARAQPTVEASTASS
jgi:hypothetical protein